MTERESDKTNVCPGCGVRFTCGMNAGYAQCWCAQLPPLMALPAVPAGSSEACFCPDCLARRVNGESSAEPMSRQ